jgi:hypothetical protein
MFPIICIVLAVATHTESNAACLICIAFHGAAKKQIAVDTSGRGEWEMG